MQDFAVDFWYNGCKGKSQNGSKSLHKVVNGMYKYSNGQISLADFRQPVGMHLKEDNRWVKKAQTIPWLEVEKRYAALFTNRRGHVAKPLRLALGAWAKLTR